MLLIEQLATHVVERWERHDLAEAVRNLVKHLDELKQERLDHGLTIGAARSNYALRSDDNIEIDDEPMLSIAGNGVWVSAWVWVPIEGEEG